MLVQIIKDYVGVPAARFEGFATVFPFPLIRFADLSVFAERADNVQLAFDARFCQLELLSVNRESE